MAHMVRHFGLKSYKQASGVSHASESGLDYSRLEIH